MACQRLLHRLFLNIKTSLSMFQWIPNDFFSLVIRSSSLAHFLCFLSRWPAPLIFCCWWIYSNEILHLHTWKSAYGLIQLLPPQLVMISLTWKFSRGVARPLQTKHWKESSYYNSSDISGINFLTSNVLFLRISYRKCHCRCAIKHTSFFLSTKYKQRKISIYAVKNQVTLRPKEMIYMFVT